MSKLTLTVEAETWPLAQPFVISRGSRTETHVVVASVTDGTYTGRGEAVPNVRYGESIEQTIAEIEAVRQALADGATRQDIQTLMKANAARNAVDCALWDYEAKSKGQPVWRLIGHGPQRQIITVYTLSLGTPESMAEVAKREQDRPVLKLKLGGEGDVERVAAVRAAAPKAKLVVDANEAWTVEQFKAFMPEMARLGVLLVEQPLPQADDHQLRGLPRPVPVCADESCHVATDVEGLSDRYDFINIKLDKSGGLTEALALLEAAHSRGMGMMVGCMVGTSLGMAPTHLIAQHCAFTDIDAPLLLAKDRPGGLRFHGSHAAPATPDLWG
ncbi:N-acetyl-D-Glu racemase DgcA [Lacibacterium aquatile]|uniref:Dipeptide epimerase n=1 Tax=Lacibacterium aquatile TaxID=1168082 RepID=A0ABW5DUG0_9PROT